MYALVIATEPDEVAIFSLILQRAGLTVTVKAELAQALQNWSERPADMILLASPRKAIQEQVGQIRAETHVPLILILETATEQIQCDLLKRGADLVLAPPISPRLLIAQVGALMRRAGGMLAFSLPSLDAEGFCLDTTNRVIEIAGQPAKRLTHLEFRLLYTLMVNRGQVVPTDIIVERVWGYTDQGDRELVRGLISRLRTKVEPDPHNPRYVLTVPGVGYTFKDTTEA